MFSEKSPLTTVRRKITFGLGDSYVISRNVHRSRLYVGSNVELVPVNKNK